MQDQSVLFIGGSREGEHALGKIPGMLTYVDGILVKPDEDGAIEAPLNALVETYIWERLPDDGCSGESDHAYILLGLERSDALQRLGKFR